MTSADSMSDTDMERRHFEMMCSVNNNKSNDVVGDENVSLADSEIERMHLEMIGAVPSDEPEKPNNTESSRKVVFGLLGNWKRSENGGEVKKEDSDKPLNVLSTRTLILRDDSRGKTRGLFSFPVQKDRQKATVPPVTTQGNVRPGLNRRTSGMSSRLLDDDFDLCMGGGGRSRMKKSRSNPDLSQLNIDIEDMSVQSSITNDQALTPHDEELKSNWVDISHKRDKSHFADSFVNQKDNYGSDEIKLSSSVPKNLRSYSKDNEDTAPPTLSGPSNTEPTTSSAAAPSGTKRGIFSFIGNKNESKSKTTAIASPPMAPLTRTTTPPVTTAADEIQKIYDNFEDFLDNHKDGNHPAPVVEEAEQQQQPPTPVINSKGGIFRLIGGRSQKVHGIEETIHEESEMSNHYPKVASTPDMHKLYSLYPETAKFIPT